MSTEMQTKMQASPAQNFTPAQTGLLQRQCTLCNTPGLVEDSGQDKEKLTLQHSSADQAGTTTVPRFGHDFSRVSVHSNGPGMIQAKLKINEPGDIYEQEADRVADAVMRMPEQEGVQQQVEPEEEELVHPKLAASAEYSIQRQIWEGGEEFLQPKASIGQTSEVTSNVETSVHTLKGGGQPLPKFVRNYFEPRFGNDFSQVRVHTGPLAAKSASDVNAKAFTAGKDVVFGAGQYSPDTATGKRLLAHELTHVVQQEKTGATHTYVIQRVFGCAPTPTEEELIGEYTSDWGDLDEEALGKELVAFALSDQIDFVESVIDTLGYNERDDVAYEFAAKATDTELKLIACSDKGRNLLEILKHELYAGGSISEGKRMREIIKEVQTEIRNKREEMMEAPDTNFTVNVYSTNPIDPAELTMQYIATTRLGTSIGVENIGNLLKWIEDESKRRKEAGLQHYQIEAMSLFGHGQPGGFAIGEYMYTAESLKGYHPVSKYVKSGATIIFDGCDAATEPGGKELMEEFGRIFFDGKSGILRGNTCTARVAPSEPTSCKPVEFRYPEMKKYTPEELVKEAFGNP